MALTFDDGPSPTWTPQVLYLLQQAGIKATFCLIGTEVAEYPKLVADIVQAGHTLCNHSWHHDMDLGQRSDGEIRSNLTRTNDAIHRAVPGARIDYYRQPGGFWTPRVVEDAESLGMRPLHWTVDPQDWRRPGPDPIVNFVSGGTQPGSIVLMHDGGGDRSGTVTACRRLFPLLKQRYTFTSAP